MARRPSNLAKKSLVVDPRALREWVKLGRYKTASEAVRAAIAEVLANRRMRRGSEDPVEALYGVLRLGRSTDAFVDLLRGRPDRP
ncbi:MAG TPA: hypothetical protein VGQ83_16985 [Polyangia bacterium]|jgi:Arc/MetJ-type ribon-helix-helix transcriptional regulator